MIYLGIDGGIAGALAMYNSDTNHIEMTPMPIVKALDGRNQYNIPKIIEWLEQYRDIIKLVVLEKAQPYPGIGATATFSNARNFGIMEGILASLKIPHVIVHPKTWQKRMFEGIMHKGRDQSKQASVLVAQRLFPNARFIGSEKATKLHDGMTDSALMAYYASIL